MQASKLLVVLCGVLGLAAGFVAFAVLVQMGVSFAEPHTMLGASRNVALYYILVSLGCAFGAFAVLRHQLSHALRAFIIGLSISLLGSFALCDLLYVPAFFG